MACIPSSGSPSRNAVNLNAGAKTRLAAAFLGAIVWLSLVIFSGLFGYIPSPGLAAVVVVSAMGLINPVHIRLTWNTRSINRIVMVAPSRPRC
jgi:SulP family sulfate permease